MKAKIENRNGVDYLSFTPKGMKFPTQIPVIIKGNRDEANAWTWNGSLEAPTVRPSIRTQYANEKGENVVIHYWLYNGICQCLSDCTDGNANTDIPLVDISSKELLLQELNKELEWMDNDKTPFCYGETLEQEKHIDRIIELKNLLKKLDK